MLIVAQRASLAGCVLVGLLSACSGGGEETATTAASNSAPTSALSTTTVVDTDPGRVTIDVGGEPGAGIVADGAVWAPGRGVLHVVDIETRVASDDIEVGPFPQRPLEFAGSLWVANRGDGSISVVDIASRSVSDTINLGAQFLEPASEVNGEVWVSSRDAIHVIDPTDLAVLATIEVGGASAVVLHSGLVWVTSFEDGTLTAIDPTTRTVTDSVQVGAQALTPALADEDIYVLSADGLIRIELSDLGSVVAVEPTVPHDRSPVVIGDEVWILSSNITVVDRTTLAITDEIELHANGSIVMHEGLVWLVDVLSGDLVGIDPETHEIAASAPVGTDPSSPFVSDGLVWVANTADGTLTVTEVPSS